MEIENILKSCNLRITKHRHDVLSLFIHSGHAISYSELKNQFENKIDRVSLYRMLSQLTEKNILFKIIDSSGNTSYIFDKNYSEDKTHHPHYKCKSCNDVLELPELPNEYLEKLKELKIDNFHLLAEGTCKECDNPKNE